MLVQVNSTDLFCLRTGRGRPVERGVRKSSPLGGEDFPHGGTRGRDSSISSSKSTKSRQPQSSFQRPTLPPSIGHRIVGLDKNADTVRIEGWIRPPTNSVEHAIGFGQGKAIPRCRHRSLRSPSIGHGIVGFDSPHMAAGYRGPRRRPADNVDQAVHFSDSRSSPRSRHRRPCRPRIGQRIIGFDSTNIVATVIVATDSVDHAMCRRDS